LDLPVKKSYLCIASLTNGAFVMSFSTSSGSRQPIGTRIRTGQNCPESGVWRSETTPSTTIPLAKGNTAPPYNGQACYWKLESYA